MSQEPAEDRPQRQNSEPDAEGWWARGLGVFVENRLVVALLTLLLVGVGLRVAPFEWAPEGLERDPVPVDAIPNLGVNQQIVFTSWEGRSPRDVEDQVTYPLATALLGLPGVKTVRSSSMLGASNIYVIFEEGVEFYWARSRILEKLAALPPNTLPEGATPQLGPDATALGQVYWYTLEGRDPETGEPVGGWDLHELRTVQDWTVRQALQSAGGVAEVASIGGYVREYQVDVDPDAARHGRHPRAGRPRGARVQPGRGRAHHGDQPRGVPGARRRPDRGPRGPRAGRRGHPPGPARARARRGHGGPGADVAARGARCRPGPRPWAGSSWRATAPTPARSSTASRTEIARIQPGLPTRTLADGRKSQITVVPFYDRSELVDEVLGTLSEALVQQLLITAIVVILLLGHLRSAGVIGASLPLAVLASFGLMKLGRGHGQRDVAGGHRHRHRHDGRHGDRAHREHRRAARGPAPWGEARWPRCAGPPGRSRRRWRPRR